MRNLPSRAPRHEVRLGEASFLLVSTFRNVRRSQRDGLDKMPHAYNCSEYSSRIRIPVVPIDALRYLAARKALDPGQFFERLGQLDMLFRRGIQRLSVVERGDVVQPRTDLSALRRTRIAAIRRNIHGWLVDRRSRERGPSSCLSVTINRRRRGFGLGRSRCHKRGVLALELVELVGLS